MAAGSLLGITLHQKTSIPVGKVDFLTLYPMSFNEFLLALAQEQLYELLESNDWPMITNFKAKLIGHLRQNIHVRLSKGKLAGQCPLICDGVISVLNERLMVFYQQEI